MTEYKRKEKKISGKINEKKYAKKQSELVSIENKLNK